MAMSAELGDEEIYQSVRNSQPRAIAQLLGVRRPKKWGDADLADLLEHQLKAKLAFDLKRLKEPDIAKLRTQADKPGQPLQTFDDLFHHPKPPIELLQMVKEFGKSADKHTDGPLPTEIATVLYYGAIAAALVRSGTRITELGDDRLREGFGWIIRQTWLDGRTKALFSDATRKLKS